MYFDDQKNNPIPGSSDNSQVPASGEYHYTRENNPGAQDYQGNPDSYNQTPNYGYNSNYTNNTGYTPNYQSGYVPGPDGSKRGRKKNKAPKPPKPPKNSGGAGKIVALALVCAIVGGLAGAGGVYALSAVTGSSSGGQANVAISNRDTGGTTVNTTSVEAGEPMTAAQIYSTYGSAVVSVTVNTSSGEGAGTGFIIDGTEGYILTCYHVIDGASAISITLTDSTSYEATYVGGDDDQDVAVLKIVPGEGETLDLNSVVLGDSSLLGVGDDVCAIGNALGTLANTMTTGTISALDRAISMSDGTVMNLMQTDTTINSGNSGGPLFNQYGEVIGIVNAKYSSSAYDTSTATIEGIGFAIPINDVTTIMDDLMEHGYITGKPYLGISVATVSAVTAQLYNDMVVGAYVRSVTEGSCAETAGLQQGDIITQVDGTDITTSAELIDAKNTHRAGDEMTLTVYREGDYVTIKVTLDEEQPEESPISDGTEDNSDSQDTNPYDYDYGYNYGGNNGGSYGYNWPFGYGFGYGYGN